MDWSLKASPWSATGMEQDIVQEADVPHGKNISFRTKTTSMDFSIDLKLGANGNSLQKSNTSPSGSTKRSRSSGNGSTSPFCLVDGCNSDLSNCREYHRRHKVCETHSKTAQVTIRGQKQRFCQQCSRFHALEEFDEGKRSCRKRLDGHNRRRRKPQTDANYSSGTFLTSFRGPQMIQFSGAQFYPPSGAMSPICSSFSSSESNIRKFNLVEKQSHNLFFGSSSSFKEEKHFPFMQSSDPAMNCQVESSVCQPLLGTIQLSDSVSRSRQAMLYERITAEEVPDSDCALSLLSSTQMQTAQTSGIHMLQGNSMSVDMAVHDQGGLGSMDSVLVSNGRNSMACPMMFPMQSGGSSCYKNIQTFPFHWE